MIYLFTEYDRITDENLGILLEKLPEKRRKKALRMRHRDGRISCTIGYLLFLYGFRNIYRQDGLPDFAVERNGKPYLNDYPEIHFNISHCADAAACIFGNAPVGIDIQDMRERNMRSVMRVCSPEEVRHIEDSAEPDLEFCRIWSVKESLSKLSGKGIFRDIRSLTPRGENMSTVFIEPDKYMTGASYDAHADFSVHRLTLANLIEL